MTRRRLILIAGAGSFALLLGAFMFQAIGYAPCQMCLWQRWPHAVAVALAVVGAFAPRAAVAALGALAAFSTGAIGVYHAGVEWKLWQGPTSCSGNGAGLGGFSAEGLLDTTIAETVVQCDAIVWSFLGLSMAGWNALLSFGLAAIWLVAMTRRA
ncbi:disulfide bond formation protein B [Oceaniglobus ichthyenteri]|uniref:disulfide bond formation protein B n=1 Tax=Oceaniglobus ichthyenteri TaxID=2136177 RepID=UPI000D390308|nr:disulfide bond formation protein B [Oceaniglobus ichthyenteri]